MSTCFFCVRRLQLPSNGFTCQALQMKISSSLWRPINKYLLPFGRDVKGCQKGSLWVSGEQLFAVRVAPLLKTKRKFNDLKFWKNASFDVNVDIWWYLCESGTFFCLFTRDILACLCSGIDLKVWWLITHIIHNKKGVIPKKNTHIIYTCAYIYIYTVYSICTCHISIHLCHLIIFPVFLHLTNPSHGPSASLCTKAWPSAPGYPIPGVTTEKLDVFLRFFSKDHGTRWI